MGEEASVESLQNIAHLIRIYCIEATTAAGSGHPTSCSSCCEILSVLFFKIMKYKDCAPRDASNDRFILSKGHAAPALYACWVQLGTVTKEDFMKLRHVKNDLEGHPTPRLDFIDVGTGSLGQGLAVACGMAYIGKYVDNAAYRVFCLCGDGESAEGSIWESINFASTYKLDNLVLIIDVNRLGQTGPTMFGHETANYEKRISACGFNVISVDGHNIDNLIQAFQCAEQIKDKPTCIIAKTFKGKYFPGIEDQNNWHGKPLGDKSEAVLKHLQSLLKNDGKVTFKVQHPGCTLPPVNIKNIKLDCPPSYKKEEKFATRKAYGKALVKIVKNNNRVMVFDADMRNSTFSEDIIKDAPKNFVECYIAEQNMVGVAIGAACRDRIVSFVSTFSVFLTRAFDQIRMGAISQTNINLCGSHCGISIGPDGPSQMGLEDIAMFRSIPTCTVFYPSDAVATERAVELAANCKGMCYIRTTRLNTPIFYENDQKFEIGKANVIQKSDKDKMLVIAACVTLEEALKAAPPLECKGTPIRIMDLFTIKPIDKQSIIKNAKEVGGKILVVEDHYPEGGMGEAVLSAVADQKDITVKIVAVSSVPRSGAVPDLFSLFGIDSKHIIEQSNISDGTTPQYLETLDIQKLKLWRLQKILRQTKN